MARDGTSTPHIARNGFDPEFKRLLDAARERRAQSVPLDARWYPEDRPGTVYKSGDSAPTANDKETDQ